MHTNTYFYTVNKKRKYKFLFLSKRIKKISKTGSCLKCFYRSSTCKIHFFYQLKKINDYFLFFLDFYSLHNFADRLFLILRFYGKSYQLVGKNDPNEIVYCGSCQFILFNYNFKIVNYITIKENLKFAFMNEKTRNEQNYLKKICQFRKINGKKFSRIFFHINSIIL